MVLADQEGTCEQFLFSSRGCVDDAKIKWMYVVIHDMAGRSRGSE